jgi:hypothetical protein
MVPGKKVWVGIRKFVVSGWRVGGGKVFFDRINRIDRIRNKNFLYSLYPLHPVNPVNPV